MIIMGSRQITIAIRQYFSSGEIKNFIQAQHLYNTKPDTSRASRLRGFTPSRSLNISTHVRQFVLVIYWAA